MPEIDFSFQGWVRGADIATAADIAGKRVDVSKMSSSELCEKLNNGELFISLVDAIHTSNKEEIEMFDFEERE